MVYRFVFSFKIGDKTIKQWAYVYGNTFPRGRQRNPRYGVRHWCQHAAVPIPITNRQRVSHPKCKHYGLDQTTLWTILQPLRIGSAKH